MGFIVSTPFDMGVFHWVYFAPKSASHLAFSTEVKHNHLIFKARTPIKKQSDPRRCVSWVWSGGLQRKAAPKDTVQRRYNPLE
jgi:hypothetical protein